LGDETPGTHGTFTNHSAVATKRLAYNSKFHPENSGTCHPNLRSLQCVSIFSVSSLGSRTRPPKKGPSPKKPHETPVHETPRSASRTTRTTDQAAPRPLPHGGFFRTQARAPRQNERDPRSSDLVAGEGDKLPALRLFSYRPAIRKRMAQGLATSHCGIAVLSESIYSRHEAVR
jgi:hypothetical protein